MTATYNKETRKWTIICESNQEFGQLFDCAIFAHVEGHDEYAKQKRESVQAMRRFFSDAFTNLRE